MYRLARCQGKRLGGVFLSLFLFAAHAQRPNIVFILTDDMGYGDLSAYGRKEYATPNLDRLAEQGMKFTNAYSAGAVCTPTRTALLTGRYPARTPVGLREPLVPTRKDSAVGLTTAYPSLASLMKASGYQTALIGKWHLGFRPEHSPVRNGFDSFFGIHGGAADYVSHQAGVRVPDLHENEAPVQVEGYLTDLFTQKAVAFLRQKHATPFLLMLHYNAPHWPWQAPGDKPYPDSVNFRQGGSPAVYAAMMKRLDEGVETVLRTLDEQGLSDRTVVVFTNDNGGEKFSDNGGLTNAKGTLWEGGIRVPAFVRWPGHVRPGSLTAQVAVTMDWTATILALGGAKSDKNFPLDGIDLTPILMEKKNSVARTLCWRTHQRARQKAIRFRNWKYMMDEEGEYVFNLADDPGEKNNLKDAQPALLAQLKKKLADWEQTMLPPVPL